MNYCQILRKVNKPIQVIIYEEEKEKEEEKRRFVHAPQDILKLAMNKFGTFPK